MSAISTKAFSLSSLKQAWEDTEQRDAEDGVIAPSISRFKESAMQRLKLMHSELTAGTYSPRPFTEVPIVTNDKKRTIHVPSVEDRIVARTILSIVTPIVDPLLGASSFGYRPGLGVSDAVQTIVEARETGLTWVLRTDVDDCFPTLPRDQALERFANTVGDKALTAVVSKLMQRTIANVSSRGKSPPGLPLGCPLSPLLMNLLLVDLDDALNEAGFTVIRYADDISVLGNSEQEMHCAIKIGSKVLERFGMKLGEDKTEIMTFQDGFAFLGEEFGPKYPPFLPLQHVPNPEDRVLYVGAQTSRMRISKGRIIIEDGEYKPHDKKTKDNTKTATKILDVPSGQINRIVTFGSVGVSAGLRSWAMQHGIDIILASRRGSYLGCMVGAKTKAHSARILAQANIQNSPRRVLIAREIVRAKILKQIVVLHRFGKRESEDYLKTAITRMRKYMALLDDTSSVEEVMGLEGASAKEYFTAYGSLFPNDLQFANRSRRPPRDPANAALSFLYTVLCGECVTAVNAAGMEPSLGILHSPDEKRPSLALDVMEEFRPLVVDQVVLNAARRNRLKLQHARTDDKGNGILLTKKGREAILHAYEERMLQVVRGSLPDFAGSIRRHLYRQAQRLAGTITNEDYEWTGMSWRR